MNEQLSLFIFHAAVYNAFFFLLWRAKAKRGLRLFDEKGFAANLPVLIELQLAGVLLFAIIPLAVDSGSFMFFDGFDFENPSTWITAALMVLSIIITPRILEKQFRSLPDMQTSPPPGAAFNLIYFIIRILFIVAYECWFRGFLLTDSIEGFGLTWAVLLNIGLYALLHVVVSTRNTSIKTWAGC